MLKSRKQVAGINDVTMKASMFVEKCFEIHQNTTVPCMSRANCARHMHHLLSVPILTIENYFHSQVTAFFMRTKKVLNSVSQKSRIDEIFIIIAKRLTKHKVKWQH